MGQIETEQANGADTHEALAQTTVAAILAGGAGTRLAPLTRSICKPALPFGASLRSIDFSLSNCVNSGIRTIGVATQHQPQELLQHLRDAWTGNRAATNAVVTPWRAEVRAPRLGYRGTADAVYRNLDAIMARDCRLVLVLAGDHVYKMDYRPMLARHVAAGAGVTIGCVEVPAADARHFGVLLAASDGRIERFVEKPRTRAELPGNGRATVLASMGIYVFDVDYLARALTADAFAAESQHDFGADVLPRSVREGRALAYRFDAAADGGPAYWRDIGTLGAFWQTHMDLLGRTPTLALDDASWPVATGNNTPLRIVGSHLTPDRGTIEDSLVAPDCSVAGQARHSVLFRGVSIARDANVADSVVMPGARIGAGARLRGVIVDRDCIVPAGTLIERRPTPGTPFEPEVLSDPARADATLWRANGLA